MTLNIDSEDVLYRLACECEVLFDQLQKTLPQTKLEVTTTDLFAEFQQRFSIWAAHLGVFARKSQCLDTRLRNLPDLQDLVARLLDILRRSLQQCNDETKIQRDIDQAPVGLDESHPKASIQTAILTAIDNTLARLNRLGVTIRRSSRDKIDTKAKTFAAGLDLNPFACLCANAVHALYPGARQSLKDYLSKSMTDRYAKMLFLNARNKKLESRREPHIGLSPIPEVSNNEMQKNDPITQPARGIPVVANLPKEPTALSQSDLSSVNMRQIRSRLRQPDEASTKFPKTTSVQVNQSNYPRLPVMNGDSDIFTCEWCSELLSKKSLSDSEWRRHIHRDLNPYVCLSEECLEAHPTYSTFDEWFSHMRLHDRRWHQQVYLSSSWICTVCESNPDVYSNPEALYSHLKESHGGDFTENELQVVSRQSKTAQPRAWNDCLLCSFATEEQKDSGEAVFPKRGKESPKQETAKCARKTHAMTNPDHHSSDPDFSDLSSDLEDMGSHRHRPQHSNDRSKAVAQHIAIHLQVLMLLTLRFAALQKDDGVSDDDFKSHYVDTDDGNSALKGNDLGTISDIDSQADVTMKSMDNEDNAGDTMDLDDDVVVDDIPIPDTDLDLRNVPRQCDRLAAENDAFLKRIIESGAYQFSRELYNDMPRARSLSSSQPSSLRRLKVVKEGTQNIHIILVPGVGTLACDSWSLCNQPWTDALAQLDIGVTMHCYDYDTSLSDQFSWQHLLDEGAKLHSKLRAFLDSQKESQTLLFICHGLGGAIAKQVRRPISQSIVTKRAICLFPKALCIAGTPNNQHSDILNTVAGIVFLGTPHRLEGGASDEELSDRFTRILKLDIKNTTPLSSKSLKRLKREFRLILDVADRFNEANLRLNILSIFEERNTPIKDARALISRLRDSIIVDEPFCSIKTSSEDRFGVPLDHIQLPSMREEHGASILSIRHWLEWFIRLHGKSHDVEVSMAPTNNSLLLNQPHQSVMQQAAKAEVSSPPDPRTLSYVDTVSSPGHKSLVALLEFFSVEQRDPKIPCFMMDTHVRNKDFYGRQDVLSKLDDCLLPSKDTLPSSQPDQIRVGILCGMPGLGKTEIAMEYAFTRKRDFDAVFWIRADDVSKLESDFAQIAIKLEIQDPREPDDRINNKGLAIEWLRNPFKTDRGTGNKLRASWLVIFDNADEPDILRQYSEIANSGAVLITSRSPLASTTFSQHAISVDVQPFDLEDSGFFVQKFTGIQGRLEEARQVGNRLGGLPLALAQMAGIIRLDFLTYTEFMRLYDAGEILEMEDQPPQVPARSNVSTVLEKLSDAARAILEVSSFLDPDSIQERILMSSATNIDMPSYPEKQGPFFNARKQLIGSSIFRHNQETKEYWMHRVTRDVVRGRIEPERQRRVFSNAVTMVAAAWPAGEVESHDVKLWEEYKALYPHVISLKDAYKKYFKHEEYVDGDFEFAGLLNRAGWYQHERGESPIIKPLLELALELCNRSKEIDHQDLESDIRHTLGAVASGTNDAVSSMDHNKTVLEIRLKIAEKRGAVDEKLASAYNQMGISWMMAGEYTKGEESFATSAREYEKIPDYTKDKRSLALVNLGTTKWLQGDLSGASRVLEMGLADREEIYGDMDSHCFRTGRFLHALGNVRFSQGLIKESEDFHQRALQQYQSTIRNRHHRTADVCHKMAQHCLRNGLLDDAIGFIDQALKNWSVDSATYAREISRTSYLKSKVLSEARQEDEAKKLLREAASMRHEITGVERDGKDLREEDFDELVTFWSR